MVCSGLLLRGPDVGRRNRPRQGAMQQADPGRGLSTSQVFPGVMEL